MVYLAFFGAIWLFLKVDLAFFAYDYLAILIDTATRWIYGWSRLVTGHKKAEVAEVKPSQNFPLHCETAPNPCKFRQQKPNQ